MPKPNLMPLWRPLDEKPTGERPWAWAPVILPCLTQTGPGASALLLSGKTGKTAATCIEAASPLLGCAKAAWRCCLSALCPPGSFVLSLPKVLSSLWTRCARGPYLPLPTLPLKFGMTPVERKLE